MLDEQGVSKRELARRLAGTDDEKKVAGRRRQVVRWVNGDTENPTRITRRRVALALGLEADYFNRSVGRADAMLARLEQLEAGQGSLEDKVGELERAMQLLLAELRAPQADTTAHLAGRPPTRGVVQ